MGLEQIKEHSLLLLSSPLSLSLSLSLSLYKDRDKG